MLSACEACERGTLELELEFELEMWSGYAADPLSCLLLGYKMNARSIRGTRGSAD